MHHVLLRSRWSVVAVFVALVTWYPRRLGGRLPFHQLHTCWTALLAAGTRAECFYVAAWLALQKEPQPQHMVLDEDVVGLSPVHPVTTQRNRMVPQRQGV